MSDYKFYPPPPTPQQLVSFATWNDGFSDDELDRIETSCDMLPRIKSTISDKAIDDSYDHQRKSTTAWVHISEENRWFYDRMAFIGRSINAQFYNFDLYGFVEDFQYTYYDENGSHYNWHVDASWTVSVPRKLSLVLQLSHPQDYDGGDLEIMHHGIETVTKKRGLVAAFPSFANHRVTPVTRGLRKSIVVWIAGPAFK